MIEAQVSLNFPHGEEVEVESSTVRVIQHLLEMEGPDLLSPGPQQEPALNQRLRPVGLDRWVEMGNRSIALMHQRDHFSLSASQED
jgi:hypothetical protein